MSNTLNISGRATGDPELRFTANGKAVANFTIADNHRKKQGNEWVDDGTTFIRVTVWEHLAEQVAEKVRKGAVVSAAGQLRQRDYETREGEKRTAFELHAQEVSLPLPRFAPRDAQPRQQQAAADDPWGGAPAQSNDEPPF